MDTHDNMDESQMYFAKWKKPFAWHSGEDQIQGQNQSVVAKGRGGQNLTTDVQQEEGSGADGTIPCG